MTDTAHLHIGTTFKAWCKSIVSTFREYQPKCAALKRAKFGSYSMTFPQSQDEVQPQQGTNGPSIWRDIELPRNFHSFKYQTSLDYVGALQTCRVLPRSRGGVQAFD